MRTIYDDFVVALEQAGLHIGNISFAPGPSNDHLIVQSAVIVRDDGKGPRPVQIKCTKCSSRYLVPSGTLAEDIPNLCPGCGHL